MNAETILKQWEETMADADAELKASRGTKNKDLIREAQEVWHWAKAKLDAAATEVVKEQLGIETSIAVTTSSNSEEE